MAGLMPHPEHAVDPLLGSTDGRVLLPGCSTSPEHRWRRERSRRAARYDSSPSACRVNAVSPQPLHRSLGLTDDEFARIGELLGREPNDFELAVFSLLWSEHCGYKHSRPLLRRLPDRRPARAAGPGRERRRDRRGRRPRGRAQGREPQPPLAPSSPSRARPPASAASSATSSRWARGRSRSSTRCASASSTTPHSGTCSRRRGRGRRPLRQLRRRRQRRRRGRVRRRLRAQLPGQRDVRRACCRPTGCSAPRAGRRRQPAGAVRLAHRPRRHRRRVACWPRRGSTRARAGKRPERPDRRSLHRQEADRVHARAARRRPARARCRTWARPGLPPSTVGDGGRRRRRPRRRPLARCRCARPGMQPFEIMISESQERMAAIVEPARLAAGRGPVPPLGRWTRP